MLKFKLDDAGGLATAERLRRFGNVVSEFFVQDWTLTATNLKPESMWIAQDSAPGLSIGRSFAHPMTATCFQARPPQERTYYALTSNRSFRVTTPERDITAGADDIIILSNAQPCSVICTRPNISSVFVVDGAVLDSMIPDAQRLQGRCIATPRQSAELLRRTLDLAWTCSEENCLDRASPRIIRLFAEQLALIDLLDPTDNQPEVDDVSRVNGCRERVKSFIDAHIRQPDLSIALVAATLGYSTRYVQHCFARSGETASGYLRRKRVLTAAMMLRNIESRHLSVTEIAFACGYSSSSHFSTEFRSMFGLTPSDFRRDSAMSVSNLNLPLQ